MSPCDEAETFVVQHVFMHLSVNIPNDDLGEFVDTLVVVLRSSYESESPVIHVHPCARVQKSAV